MWAWRHPEAVGRPTPGGEELALSIAPARLEQQLQRAETGALAGVWKKQSKAISAAVTIQAAVRGRRQRSFRQKKGGGGSRGGHSRRRSSASSR
jgi:hypothetical protein